MKFSVPSSSSVPQRPQFLTDSKISSNSASVTGAGRVSVAIVRLVSNRLALPLPEHSLTSRSFDPLEYESLPRLLTSVQPAIRADPGHAGRQIGGPRTSQRPPGA